MNDDLLVISPKLRDVLVQFDLGATQFFEVPICLADGRTVSDYPPHYILHVAETKDCFVPEASEHVRQSDRTGSGPDAPWFTDARSDQLAVRATALEGVDIWGHPNLRERLFLSDRLKRAIDEAGVTQRGLEPIAAKVLN